MQAGYRKVSAGMEASMVALAELNTANEAAFGALIGPLFEATPSLATTLWHRRPFADAAALKLAAADMIRSLPNAQKLAYVAVHPELAGAAARLGEMGAHSADEQAGVRLDRLDADQQARFDRNNAAYRERFGFPFIAAVRFHTRDSLLAAFSARLENTREVELQAAIDEICKIVSLRIDTLLEP
jgi:OHCU decarboxylase